MAALPYFDEIDPSIVNVLLITHFHLDHAASLPYFLEKTTFRGRVFMTYTTKAIYKLLLSDFVKHTSRTMTCCWHMGTMGMYKKRCYYTKIEESLPSEGCTFPRKISFNGDEPSPDTYPNSSTQLMSPQKPSHTFLFNVTAPTIFLEV
ncbi:Cleavage and polyadenylation specificity factor subunit 3-I [Glycine soja]|uniref:Cleavage and polyadenylation specificity factor subunit 3-I n=1 Tax=Glycine soja TaxID=3848 RepID=A0A445HRE3_GLYSO|nr:Cleavage and polyadenylation specificity factor subunit 3-I [Glycine soja]